MERDRISQIKVELTRLFAAFNAGEWKTAPSTVNTRCDSCLSNVNDIARWTEVFCMTLAEDLRTKYGLTSLKLGGSCLPLTAINEALEAAAQIADRSHAPEIANQIRALKWEAQAETPPIYVSEIQAARDAA